MSPFSAARQTSLTRNRLTSAFEENGSRIDDMKLIVGKVAMAASLFDQDGIQVRFMNSRVDGNNINSEAAASALMQQVKFSGLTPLGTALQQKIMEVRLSSCDILKLGWLSRIAIATRSRPCSRRPSAKARSYHRCHRWSSRRRGPLHYRQGKVSAGFESGLARDRISDHLTFHAGHQGRQPRARSHSLRIGRYQLPVRSGRQRSRRPQVLRGDRQSP